ncbi:hypothetical protein ACFSC3_09415 [Sphingomonas floccifaciens]|uniref:DUF1488 family protein n=1 Tax=Sphingomonas floccifaciens TaxID=1844115 RepID=A0ABW4NCR5_9SPHN
MADNDLTIHPASIFDNPTDRRVEFRGEVDGETRDYGVTYSVLEALTGSIPDRPAMAFGAVQDAVARAALAALARADAEDVIVVSERDLDQSGTSAITPNTDRAVSEAEAHPS